MLVALTACAAGEGPPKPSITSTPAGVDDPTSGGDDTSDASTTGGSDIDETTGSIDETTTSADPSSPVTTDPSEESSGGDDESSSGDPPEPTCDLMQQCQGAQSIGGLPGDESGAPITETGTAPIWLEVQVSEQSSSIDGDPMELTIRLDSVGGDFDLDAYLGPTAGLTGCGGTLQSSTQSGGPDAVSFEWGETGTFANNADDGAFVAIWIYPKNNVCTPGASWTLTATGG